MENRERADDEDDFMHWVARSVSLASACSIFGLLVGCAAATPEDFGSSDDHLNAQSGRTISANSVAALIRQVGFPENVVSKMVCTAYYESRFDPRNINHDSNGTTDYGLFQVNSIHLQDQGCPHTVEGMYDPTANAKCALLIFNADKKRGHDGITAPWAAYRGHPECASPAKPGAPWAFDGSGGSVTPPTPGQKPCASPNPDIGSTADQIACGGNANACGLDSGHTCVNASDCCSKSCTDDGTGRMSCGGVPSASTAAATATPGGTCNREGGFYCGNPASNLKGDPNTLYHCVNNRMVVTQVCASGCSVAAQGVDDSCRGDQDFSGGGTVASGGNTTTGGQFDIPQACVAPDAACAGPDAVCCDDTLGLQRFCVEDPNAPNSNRFVCSLF
jgi:hypothetical protein